ncbi:MAG: (Fe-S)-binding protein [Thermoplasmata archaeon]|nr:(Fe-S)-binding protein [Thermoplasmata archaeon]
MELKLDKFEYDLYTCLQCGYCQSVCPMYDQLGWESASPRGKLFYVKQLTERNFFDALLGRKLKIDGEFIQRIYQCTGCGACEEVCHENIKLHELWKKIKDNFFEQGLINIDVHKKVHERIYKYKNPFGEPPENRGNWLPKDVKLSKNPEVVFFQGCTESYRKQELAQTTVRILHKAGVPFTILGAEEWCCGSICINTGQIDYIDEYAKHNVKAIKETGATTLVAACAGCYNTIKNEYPKLVGELPVELYHVSEYVEKIIKEKKLKFTKTIDKTVTFHDSCHLGRGAGVFDAPRNVLNSIPGIKLTEMYRSRERSRCCGAGCGCVAAFNDIASALAKDRVQEAEDVGAELIVTTCPFCNLNLNRAGEDNGGMKTVDVVELAYQAL